MILDKDAIFLSNGCFSVKTGELDRHQTARLSSLPHQGHASKGSFLLGFTCKCWVNVQSAVLNNILTKIN